MPFSSAPPQGQESSAESSHSPPDLMCDQPVLFEPGACAFLMKLQKEREGADQYGGHRGGEEEGQRGLTEQERTKEQK